MIMTMMEREERERELKGGFFIPRMLCLRRVYVEREREKNSTPSSLSNSEL